MRIDPGLRSCSRSGNLEENAFALVACKCYCSTIVNCTNRLYLLALVRTLASKSYFCLEFNLRREDPGARARHSKNLHDLQEAPNFCESKFVQP